MEYNNLFNSEMGGFIGAIVGILIMFLFFIIILLIILYIFQGIGLSKIAKRMNIKNSWLAWIPFANMFLLGQVSMEDNIGIALVALLVLSSLANKIAFLKLASFGYVVLLFIVAHNLYKKLSDKATVMTVFSVLTGGILIPIFIFAIRNNEIRKN